VFTHAIHQYKTHNKGATFILIVCTKIWSTVYINSAVSTEERTPSHTHSTSLMLCVSDVYCASWQTACCAETSDRPVQQITEKLIKYHAVPVL